MKKVIAQQSIPSDVVLINQTDTTTEGKLYGVEHKKFISNGKRFKVHVRADSGKHELIGFRNSTGHLNEEQGFANLQEVFDYCNEKGHKLLEFNDRNDFAEWLIS